MMKTIRVEEIATYEGQEIQIKGRVYNGTRKGKLVFLLVRDGSGFVQCVAFKPDLNPDLFEQIIRLTQDSAVVITGIVLADERFPGIAGGYEARIMNTEVIQAAFDDYRLGLKEHGVDFALDNRHLSIFIGFFQTTCFAPAPTATISVTRLREFGFFRSQHRMVVCLGRRQMPTEYRVKAYLCQTGRRFQVSGRSQD